ncbi:MAG: TolC family protein, partial [Deltaproteobacteria bacterium]|nr:TolC family protein [Deltaproteobacteria bacterium]
AMAHMPDQMGSLPDPMLNLGAMNVPTDTYALDKDSMTMLQVGVTQAFPWWGKRAMKQEAFQREALAGEDEARETRLVLVRDVTSGWWELVFLDRSLEIVARNKELMRQLVELASTKYKVGRGLQQDVLRAQVELSKMTDEEIRMKGMRAMEASRFAALLHLPPARPVVLPPLADESLPEMDPSWTARGEQPGEDLAAARPVVAARKEGMEAARSRLELAQRDYWPNLTLGVSYGIRPYKTIDGMTMPPVVSVMVGIQMPLYAGWKQSEQEDQRREELSMREYAFHQGVDQARAEIGMALAAYQQAREQAVLYKTGIIPQSQQTLSAMYSAYQVSKVDFLEVTEAQITLYKYETEYWRALKEARQALARLAAALGQEKL